MGARKHEPGDKAKKQLARLARFGVATLHEAMGQGGLMEAQICARQSGPAVAGRAITVSTAAGDNWALHIALERCAPGDLLVVAADPPDPFGYFGDLMATAAQARGCVGLVIDGGVRDIAALRQMRFAVWSRHICARGTAKRTPGRVNAEITCGGVRVRPGDIVVADEDGVVVVPTDEADAIHTRARARARMERRMRKALRAGQGTLSLLGLTDGDAAD